ncbi:phosphoribosyl-ATP diphosphatase [Coprinopsis cinerea okayama7|uniref:Phosphoribosyl-ATP diphosphatase n=1 Tax=Coprinopsis cinerea (strain Okayama-7 / 130 / ATCC MYA-4618 / FGSC 9003) TaxID=240176 RepID=A8NG81_COPC7|nr:phosphoribosyl-ATP diphosphatase [Coprinopsis cinerea okayama7\|eukprot:XP_001833503.2 phosphoribosyl-ATP diphosphatase [Coprinopsis cinerea okayama7\
MVNPKIDAVQDLDTSDARWISLKKLTYTDQDGKQRPWEMATRRTRSTSGIDAVAILTILKSKKNTFPPSTVVIEQYRPPIDKYVVELPAGLIDEGETPEQAAIRELKEETGYQSDTIVESSPVIVSDPGMTNANMKLVTISVTLEDELLTPKPSLEVGEHIVTKVIALSELHQKLLEYDQKVCLHDVYM